MTFEELKSIGLSIDEKMNTLRIEMRSAKEQYIKEHTPVELKNGDNITIKLEVTEESIKNVQKKCLNLPRYQVGHRYYKRGIFYGWVIDSKTGEVKPDLKYGVWYDFSDKIISIKKTRGR